MVLCGIDLTMGPYKCESLLGSEKKEENGRLDL